MFDASDKVIEIVVVAMTPLIVFCLSGVWLVSTCPPGLNLGPLPGNIPKAPPSFWALQITPIIISMNKSHIASLEFVVIFTIIWIC